MKSFLTLIALWLTCFTSAQQIFTVKDENTREPVPYVNITFSEKTEGTTADENGKFSIPDSNSEEFLVFSAIGYKPLKIKIKEMPSVILLNEMAIELQELVLKKTTYHEKKLGKLITNNINHYFGCRSTPWMIGKKFVLNDNQYDNFFIRKISFLSDSRQQKSVMNIRLMSIDSSGLPGKYIFNKNLVCPVEKGLKHTEIDISQFNVVMPPQGVYVIFEWLIIDENQFTEKRVTDISKPYKTEHITAYNPSIARTLKTNTDYNDARYSRGKWNIGLDDGYTIDAELLITN
ncbi:carboxypeptidase-like regulatory domain-containing protein [Flavobacterium psychrotrophum]|uniref:carboxypeptidase-like regulatory domain-containing protein n=1 Tax=Flavobacterium psychrotrophum TaxID=2294119 RepID=UPI000E31AA3C|nr:carboxypeptidase-like regulatory domain-containing protein [Flavobacterium psychrotrophum]